MERREALQLGGILGAASLGGVGACLAPAMPPARPEAEVQGLVRKLDQDLDAISRFDMLDEYARRTGVQTRFGPETRSLVQRSTRALHTSAAFRSLPEDLWLHPAVQQRVLDRVDDMEGAVSGMTERLALVDARGHRLLKDSLQTPRTSAEVMSQVFDHGMAGLQLGIDRRFQVRSIFSQLGARLQHQPAAAIDEYLTKARKVRGSVGTEVELQRRIAAQVGQETYWRYQHRLALLARAPVPPAAPPVGSSAAPASSVVVAAVSASAAASVVPGAPPAGPVVQPPVADGGAALWKAQEIDRLMLEVELAAREHNCGALEFLGRRIGAWDREAYRTRFLPHPLWCVCRWRAAEERTERGVLNPGARSAREAVNGTGSWMMGIGLVTGLVSGLIVSAIPIVGAIGLTVAVLLLLGGLIVLLVGVAMPES